MPSRPKSPGPLSGTKPASPADANTTPSTPTDILPPEALRSLEEIGVDVSNATKLLHAVRTISATSYRGPIPPAEMLAEYERIQAGLARQIIGWTEAQQAHRQSMDRIAIESEQARLNRAQRFGLAVAVLGLIIAGLLGVFGNGWVAAVVAIVAIGGPNAATVLARILDRQRG